jgi:serine/threonine-protein kinase
MDEPLPLGTLTPDDFRRVRQIFEEALDRPAAERRAFLEHACNGNTMLAAEVERMLAADSRRHDLLDERAAPPREPYGSAAPSVCSSCGAVVAATDRFCRACGTPVAGAVGQDGRFRPGALFAGRFRIVSRLGHGGMGDVYRADDLELGQPVALKFLTALRSDDRARARLRTEVRLARQIAHPNVCRVYDIGEVHGELYLSMEYVDGEDLAALLKRIGRLPIDKGVEVARKLCAGLAAAHAKGVLHRDFKPANIMIDGHGEVRIMDFGLAAMAERVDKADVRSGTPAYMSPEQLAGREATVQSDLYALGLVLYELFTGRPAFEAKDAQELLRLREGSKVTKPSTLIPELSERVERVVLRCLDPDPKLRPASALDVSAALPGGNPLAEALAAGETPSPELVAAAGEVGSISPVVGLAGLVAVALGLAAIVWFSNRTTLLGLVTVDRIPEVLADRARSIARELGYTETPRDSAYGYEVDNGYVRYVRDNDASTSRWEAIRRTRPAPLLFWYRQSPQSLRPTDLAVTRADPVDTAANSLTIVLDPAGRLTGLRAIPSRDESTERSEPDWSRLFALAGLDVRDFQPSPPARRPPMHADARAAWTGAFRERPDVPIRVEAASAAGRPVHFEIAAPWTPLEPEQPPAYLYTTGQRLRDFALQTLMAAVFGVALLLAWRNARLGRGDRRGALRMGVLMGGLSLVQGLLNVHDLGEVLPTGGRGLAVAAALTNGVLMWMLYMAIEPHVRRIWPELLIGWSRLLAGRFRDPLVGRDVLVGLLVGIVTAVILFARTPLHVWLGLAPPPPDGTGFLAPRLSLFLEGGLGATSLLFGSVSGGVEVGLFFAVGLLMFAIVLRRRPVAIAVYLVFYTFAAPLFPDDHPVIGLVLRALVVAIWCGLLVRFGLLPYVVSYIPWVGLTSSAFAFGSSVPYAAASYVLIGSVAALAIYGVHTALAGQPLLGAVFASDRRSGAL